MSLARLPKVELHLHLEGAAPSALIRDLARESRVDLSGLFTPEGGYRWRGPAGLASAQAAACTALTRPEHCRRLLLAVAEALAADAVVYAEILVAPDLCGGRSLDAWRDHLAALVEAAAEAEARTGVTIRAIATILRQNGPAAARETALCAAETAGGMLVGLGMAGDENICDPGDFAWAFDCAREAGLGLTAHAGEGAGADAVRATLRALRVTRIGAGPGAAVDPALAEALAEQGVVLELCPGAGIALGLCRSWRDQPIARLHDRGVAVTISTDHPAWLGTSMTRDYDRLAEAFDWDAGLFATLARTALDAAFCDPATRERIAKKLETRDA